MTAHGIRSSYQLTTPARNDAAVVIEIRPPRHVVIDGKTGVLRAVWTGAQVLAHARKAGL